MDERLGPGRDRKWLKLGFSKPNESKKRRKTFRYPKDAVRAWVLIGQPCEATAFASVRAPVIYCVMFVCTVPIVFMPSSPVSGTCCAEQYPFKNQSDLRLISKCPSSQRSR